MNILKKIIVFLGLNICVIVVYGQSIVRVMGGYNQSIFYCSQAKSVYRHSYTPYDSYLITLDYRENLSSLQKNLQLGCQVEYKRQSQWFYYEDEYPMDTVATGVRYDISSVNLVLFPELQVGNKVKFFFNAGPVLQVIVNTKAKGVTKKLITGTASPEEPYTQHNSKDIRGLCFGLKISLGIEIPIYKGFSFNFCNSYSAGLTGMQGLLSQRMKYFNCLDINVCAGFSYRIEHKNLDKKIAPQ